MKLNKFFALLLPVFLFAYPSVAASLSLSNPTGASQNRQIRRAVEFPFSKSAPVMLASSDESELGKMDAASPAVPLSKEQLGELLDKRLPANMGVSFYQFANMVLVPVQAKSGQAIGLETSSDKIGKTILRSPFPAFYRPTLRQFLDEIAWQTKSKWKYDSDVKATNKKIQGNSAVKELALFEFTESERAKPYELSLAKGWTAADKGSWTMYSPPDSPVSMDVYEMGTYTAQDKAVEPDMLKKVPVDVALEWAKRVQPRAKQIELSNAKVGQYDAIFFEAKVKSQAKQDIHWRQWVLMDGKQCYFIVSTLFPDSEDKLFPDVEAMLKSFHILQ